jgi:hypothetical protein
LKKIPSVCNKNQASGIKKETLEKKNKHPKKKPNVWNKKRNA